MAPPQIRDAVPAYDRILAGFVRDGDTVLIETAPGGGVSLTTDVSPEEAAATNGAVMAEGGEA